MNDKTKYLKPEMEVITFCDEDVIRTSLTNGGEDDNDWVKQDKEVW